MSSTKKVGPKQPVGAPRLKVLPHTPGGRVRAARDRKKWDQPELAKRARIHQSNVSRIETNKLSPDEDTWIRLSEALDSDFGISWLRDYRQGVGVLLRYYKALPPQGQRDLIDVATDFLKEADAGTADTGNAGDAGESRETG